MHLTRLELAHPKALPPQGSVYTNFTTGAYGYYNIFFRYGEKNLEIIPILREARFFGILFPIVGTRFFPPESKSKYILRFMECDF